MRTALHINQEVLGRLLGVHAMTVSKWERGMSVVPAYQSALLECFRLAVERDMSVGTRANVALHFAGVAVALHMLLGAAFGGKRAGEL